MAYKVDSVTGELSEYIFEIGGILALRNFTARTVGERLIIESATNANFCILDALVGEVQINGVVYDDLVQAQEKLQSLVFNPNVPVLMTSQQQQMLLGALQKGTYTGTAQDLKNLIDNHTHSWNNITDKPTVSELTNVKVGGRNLIRNSHIEIYNYFFRPILTKPLINGEVYSFSFEAKGNLEGRVFFNYSTDAHYPAENTTEWKQFRVTFTFISNDYQGVQVIPHIYGATNIRNVYLERGNTPSDERPAPEDIFDEMRKTLLKTTTNISTSQNLEGYSQNGRTIVSQGTSNIVVMVDSGDGFVASYQKGGTGNITFQAGAGKNLIQVDGINTINGAKGSTATVTVVGNDILLRISNV